MATTKIVDLISRAEIITQDKTSVRWPKQEWLDWYNDAILFVVNRRPDKSVKNVNFTVDETNSKQSIPSDGIGLFTVTRNVSSGKPIREVSRNQLDDQYVDWHTRTADDIDHFIYDKRDPSSFYIYPRPNSANHSIEITYPYTPTAITVSNFDTDTQVIGVDDSFVNPILDFMLYRAYSKDRDYSENAQRATQHYQVAENAIEQKTRSDVQALGKARS